MTGNVFEAGQIKCDAEEVELFSDSASRLVGDNSGVEPKLGGDRLATELGEDGMCIGLVCSRVDVCRVQVCRVTLYKRPDRLIADD